MAKKLFLLLLVSGIVIVPVSAKRKVTKQYQRPSLHMVLLNTDEPTSEQVADLIPEIAVAWEQYEIPTLYNKLPIDFKSTNGGTPRGGMMELVTRFGTYEKLKGLTMDELKEIGELKSGKLYIMDLKERCDSVSDEIAHQLLAYWFNIQPDGTYSLDTIAKYACYSATQIAALDAAVNTEEGAQLTMLNELMDPTIANSYVTFSKVELYANEPVAAFTRDLAIITGEIAAQLNGQEFAAASAKVAAEIAYKAAKDGYSAYSTSLLYKLAWNDSVYTEFSKLLTPTNPSNPWRGKIDLEAFNAMPLGLEYVNADQCNSVVTRTIGNKNEDNAGLTRLTIRKNLNKQIVRLQNKNEEFKPMVPIVDIQPKYIVADMGTKESVRSNEIFDVIAPEVDKRGIFKYRVVGQVKVKKGTIWDNETVDMAETADNAVATQEEVIIEGTQLVGTGVKAVKPGMFVKRVRGKVNK